MLPSACPDRLLVDNQACTGRAEKGRVCRAQSSVHICDDYYLLIKSQLRHLALLLVP